MQLYEPFIVDDKRLVPRTRIRGGSKDELGTHPVSVVITPLLHGPPSLKPPPVYVSRDLDSGFVVDVMPVGERRVPAKFIRDAPGDRSFHFGRGVLHAVLHDLARNMLQPVK